MLDNAELAREAGVEERSTRAVIGALERRG
jgi:hypothetical protein